MTRNEIISNLFTGKNFRECLQKMEPDHLREDLRQEVILIICELSEEKVIQLHKDKALEFFTVRVILNQIKSSTSQFARKYRKRNEQYDEQTLVGSVARRAIIAAELLATDNIENEERLLREMIEDKAVGEVEDMANSENNSRWYAGTLLKLYAQYGNYRAIEKETGIPFGSCYKTIKKVSNKIKQKVK